MLEMQAISRIYMRGMLLGDIKFFWMLLGDNRHQEKNASTYRCMSQKKKEDAVGDTGESL